MNDDDEVLATIAKVIFNAILFFAIVKIIHHFDPMGHTFSVIGMFALSTMLWKGINYFDNN
jgi:hypothetical protein